MKTKKRILALLLSAVMLTPALFSCSETSSEETSGTSGANTPTAEETAAPEPELSDDLPDTSFNGYEFRILSVMFGGDEGAHRIMFEDYTGNPVNDALRDSTLYVEDRFDVRMSYISGGNEFDTQTTTQNTIQAGDDAFDIVIGHDGLTFTLAKQGLFYNMYDIEQFNFDKPWWTPTADLSLCNQLYCASSYLSYLGIHWTRAIMMNKDYMGNLNIEIPYNDVREGTWTLDKMLAMVEGTSFDVDGNGKINSNDEVGFCTGTQTYYCLQEAFDLSPYVHNDDGTVSFDFDLERMDTAVQKMRSLAQSSDYTQSGDGFGSEVFKLGSAMLVYGQIGDAYDIYRESDFSYGFLPTPKLDEMQGDYINCCTDLPWAIPKTISEEQSNIIGTIVEAASCYNYKNVLPAYFDVAMKNRTADSPDDAEMLQLIADTRKISFAFSYSMALNNVIGDLINSGNEVASYYASQEKSAQKTLEKLIQSFEEMKTLNESGAAAE